MSTISTPEMFLRGRRGGAAEKKAKEKTEEQADEDTEDEVDEETEKKAVENNKKEEKEKVLLFHQKVK